MRKQHIGSMRSILNSFAGMPPMYGGCKFDLPESSFPAIGSDDGHACKTCPELFLMVMVEHAIERRSARHRVSHLMYKVSFLEFINCHLSRYCSFFIAYVRSDLSEKRKDGSAEEPLQRHVVLTMRIQSNQLILFLVIASERLQRDIIACMML